METPGFDGSRGALLATLLDSNHVQLDQTCKLLHMQRDSQIACRHRQNTAYSTLQCLPAPTWTALWTSLAVSVSFEEQLGQALIGYTESQLQRVFLQVQLYFAVQADSRTHRFHCADPVSETTT